MTGCPNACFWPIEMDKNLLINCVPIAQGNLYIEVDSEDEPGRILLMKHVPRHAIYREQGEKLQLSVLQRPQLTSSDLDTILTWVEADSSIQWGLSFERVEGCMAVWYYTLVTYLSSTLPVLSNTH